MRLRIVFFQAEDGIRDLVRSRGLGDVYKRQAFLMTEPDGGAGSDPDMLATTARAVGSDWIIDGLSLIHI